MNEVQVELTGLPQVKGGSSGNLESKARAQQVDHTSAQALRLELDQVGVDLVISVTKAQQDDNTSAL